MIGMDNKVWLIDFGASDKCMQGGERTVIIKNGYAPIEQYYSDESLADGKTGPWTDVYGMAATMYTALTGEKPKSAVERLKAIRNNIRPFNSKVSDSSCPDNDIALEKKSLLNNNLEEWKANVILKGMAVDKSDRYASMEEFIEAVSFPPKKDEYTRVINGIDEYEYVKAGNNKKSLKYFIIIIIAIAALLFGIVLSSIVGNKNMQIANDNTDHSENTNIVTESKTEDDTVITENSEEKESIGNNVEHKAEDQSEITTDDKVEDSKVEDGKVQEDTGKKIEINTEDDTDNTSSELDDDELY
jgi:serine/threonine protein kinase